jgi:hypothetical protein
MGRGLSERAVNDTVPFLPRMKPGRPSEKDKAKYAKELQRFASDLKEINSRLEFPVSARGWGYILENDGKITKADLDKVEDLITECRKNGMLPIHFTSDDEARAADYLEKIDYGRPADHASTIANTLLAHVELYQPVSFWDYQPAYLELVVEKIDLKYLFGPICEEYHVPLINARGWSDLNMRARMMNRFKEHEAAGRRVILLYCGDLDPKGLQMSDMIKKNLKDLQHADGVDWDPDGVEVDRFGLNVDFIEEHGLAWIEGLITSSGNDLADPEHRHHHADFVQNYIQEFGKRKVEANALVVRPDEGRQICQEAIEKYLDLDAIDTYKQELANRRQQVRAALPSEVRKVLKTM